tara:strand:+ start:103 stop:534 length:432 start_codon:yes stop_codon:yes gene_type:complete
MIKTFKGKVADSTITKIRLSTNNGMVGYQVRKLQLFPSKFGTHDQESTVALFSVEPAAADAELNFDDPTLLAAACLSTDNSEANPLNSNVIIDSKKVNQDIWLTHEDVHPDSRPVNYYVELEQMKLDANEATVATLRDMRGRE